MPMPCPYPLPLMRKAFVLLETEAYVLFILEAPSIVLSSVAGTVIVAVFSLRNKTQLDKSSLNLKSPGSWWSSKNETNSSYLSGLKSWFIKNKYSNAESIKITKISSVKFSTEKTAGQRPETASVTFSYFVKEKSNGYILSNGSLSEKAPNIVLSSVVGTEIVAVFSLRLPFERM